MAFLSSAIVGALLFATACSNGDTATPDDANGNGDTEGAGGIGDHMQTWQEEEVCEALDPEGFMEELNGAEITEGPTYGPENSGTFMDSKSCNTMFEVEYDDESSSGRVYLHVAPVTTSDLAADLYSERIGFAEEAAAEPDWVPVADDSIEGPWEDARVIAGSDINDQLYAFFREENYMVEVELSWNTDWGVRNEILTGGDDVFSSTYLDFNLPEMTDWISETYLPEVHSSIHDEVNG